MSTIYIRPYAVDNGKDDYMVVVKPHPGGSVNRFEIADKQDAVNYAQDIADRLGFQVVDETE